MILGIFLTFLLIYEHDVHVAVLQGRIQWCFATSAMTVCFDIPFSKREVVSAFDVLDLHPAGRGFRPQCRWGGVAVTVVHTVLVVLSGLVQFADEISAVGAPEDELGAGVERAD